MDAATLWQVTPLRQTLVLMEPAEAMDVPVQELAKHESSAACRDQIALNSKCIGERRRLHHSLANFERIREESASAQANRSGWTPFASWCIEQ